ncbi:AI-2E family transporter [Teichococcus aestuarii]|uniref:AI-2E family transporter n=1 Tax=Teichococcus aestuarii TaxID=568898 RepID=UPI00360A84BD
MLQAIFGLLAAAFSVTVLALGRDLIVPLVLAVLLAFVLAPVVVVLHRLRVPQVLGVVAAVLLAAAAILGLGVVMGRQAGSLTADLPAYQQTMAAKLQSLRLGELMQEADAALRNLRQMMGDGLADRAAPGAAEMPPPVTTAPAAEGGSPLAVIGSWPGRCWRRWRPRASSSSSPSSCWSTARICATG